MSYCVRKTMVDSIKKSATSYTISPDMTRITVPASKFKKGRVDQIINRLYERGMKIFGTFGNVISMDKRDPYNPSILIHPTKQLVDAYDVKDGTKTLDEITVEPVEELNDFYMGDEALKEQEESGVSDELSLYLADQIQKNFGVTIPITNPDMFNLISTREVISQGDIDEKKLEC